MAPRQRNLHGEKEQRKSNHIRKVLQGNEATKINGFKKRIPTLEKKALELQRLCGVSVCMVCFGRDGKVHVFPNNEIELRNLVKRYKGLEEKEKNEINLMGYLEGQRTKYVHKKLDEKFLELSKWLSGFPETDALSFLDLKLMGLKEKLKFLTSQQEIQAASTSGTNDVGLLGLEEQNCIWDKSIRSSESNSNSSTNIGNNNNNVVFNFDGELGSSVVQFLPEPNNTVDYVVSDHNSATSSEQESGGRVSDYTANSCFRVPQELGHLEGNFYDSEENFGINVLLSNLDPMSYHEAVLMLAPTKL